jgi:hypothetical protein
VSGRVRASRGLPLSLRDLVGRCRVCECALYIQHALSYSLEVVEIRRGWRRECRKVSTVLCLCSECAASTTVSKSVPHDGPPRSEIRWVPLKAACFPFPRRLASAEDSW